jgi:hypothetical protein
MPIIADELLMRVLPTVCRYLVGRERGRQADKQASNLSTTLDHAAAAVSAVGVSIIAT